MGHLPLRQQYALHLHRSGRQIRTVLAFFISLAVFLSPTLVQAAPVTSALAQTTVYEDADGHFSLNVPDGFTAASDITYEMLGDNPLDKLLDSTGVAISEADTPNGVSVLFLLLDEAISDRDEFAGFLAAFQVAAGGDVLPLVDLEFEGGDTLVASGSAATRDRQLQVEIEAQDHVVAILTTSVERARYREFRDALSDAFSTFTWDPEAVLISLGGELQPTPEEPAPDEPPEPASVDEPTDDEPSDIPMPDRDTALKTERYSDPGDVYSIALPAGLEADTLSDHDEALYGYGYYGPDDDLLPTVAVAFVPAAFAARDGNGEAYFESVDDELWNQFVDVVIVEDTLGMSVYSDQRNDSYRTAFLVLEEEEDASDTPPELWVWVEESDGIGAIIAIFGELDDPVNAEIFHSAVTTFAWSPQSAASAIAEVADVIDPADAPVVFDDPFDLVAVSTPPDYPFQASYYEDESIEYTFGRNPIDGLIQVSLSAPGDGAFNASGWSLIVDETEQSVLDTLADGSLGSNARLVEKNIGEPEVRADNTALILARTDVYWMAVVLLDMDGVLATEVIIVPDSYWQENEDFLAEAVKQGVDYDPDAIRDAIDASQEHGVFVLETGTAKELPSRSEEIDWRYSFDPDDSITVAVDFTEPALEGTFKVIVIPDDLPDYPLAQFAQWLGEEEHVSYGKMTSQEETGTRAAFTYNPDYPTNPGEYTAYLHYDNQLVATNGFTVEDNPPDTTDIANFGVSYGDATSNEPLLVTEAIHPGDVVTLRGTVDLPVGSQLRLFWYDPDGWLDTGEVGTIRLDSSFHIPYDWLYFDPDIDWVPGTYSYLLTLDGEPFAEGELLVVEETAEVELMPAGEGIFDALPLPQDLTIVPVVEGIDLAVVPSDADKARDIISAVDAWLRMQGWQPTLPSIGAPVAWDYRRWIKDGYQFLVQPGTDGAEDEIWMRYAPASDVAYGPVPSGDALDAENLSVMDEVAQLDIEGLDASDAAMSSDGNWLAVTTTDGTLYIFDALRLVDTIWWQPDVYYANPVFSPDGRDLAVTLQRQSRSEVQLFSNFDVIWLPTTRFNGHTDIVTAIDYQSDGWLASSGLDGALRQWEPIGEYLPTMIDTDEPISGLAAAPEDAPGLLVAREGGWIEYRPDEGEMPWSDVETVSESPRIAAWTGFDEDGVGDLAVSGEGQVEWYVYDTEGADLVGNAPVDDEAFASTGAAFSPNGTLLAISGDTVQFYDRTTGDWLDEGDILVDDERVPITSLRMSPDGQYMIVTSEDGLTRLWAATAQ